MKKYKLQDFKENRNLPFTILFDTLTSDFAPHTHSFTELMVVLDGTANHCIHNQVFPLKRGDVLVVDEHISHSFTHVDRLKHCNILFSLDEITNTLSNLRKIPGFQRLFILEPHFRQNKDGYTSFFSLNTIQFSQLKLLLELIQDEFGLSQSYSDAVTETYLRSIIAFLSRQYDVSVSSKKRPLYHFSHSVAHIENYFCTAITLDTLADMSGLSKRQYGRVFKETYNLTPFAYITQLRLERSCSLLLDHSVTINEIAESCGFHDVSHFSRIFKQHFGISPSQYRHQGVL